MGLCPSKKSRTYERGVVPYPDTPIAVAFSLIEDYHPPCGMHRSQKHLQISRYDRTESKISKHFRRGSMVSKSSQMVHASEAASAESPISIKPNVMIRILTNMPQAQAQAR